MEYKFKADDKNVRVLGRTLYRNDIRYLGYSCTAVEFIFTGTKVSAEIFTDWELDEPWKAVFQPYVAVFVNDSEVPYKRFAVDSGTNTYEIYKAPDGKPAETKIRIMKLSENAFSKLGIVSVTTDGEHRPTVSESCRRIEFVGDSITCGFGIEGIFGKDNFMTSQENPWENYAALTARHFGADFELVSWTSIGVISNSVKEDVDEPATDWLMPPLYDYTDRAVEGYLGVDDKDKEIWDNSRFAPQLIVVNLGTNDKDYTRGVPERVKAFEDGYKAFIEKIRCKNPDAFIICALGAMGQELCPQVENAVAELNKTDKKIFSVRFDVQLEEDGIGAEMHPSLKTHRKMADKLIAKIEELKIFG